jgi:SSS family solute:Na+ symporter
LFAAAVLLALYAGLVSIGMMSLSQVSPNQSEGPLLSSIISSQGGSLLGVLLFIAIISAVMSTLDTAINTGALSLTHDVIEQIGLFRRKQSPVLMARAATMFIGIMSFIIATQFQSILKTLGLASEIMAEGLFIPGIAMIFLKRKFPSAGAISLVSGGTFAVIGFLNEIGILGWPWPSWPFSLPYGLAISGMGFLLGVVIDLKKRIS